MTQTKHTGFQKLAHAVAREYEHRGFSKKEAELIGIETAAKVYREQIARRKRRTILR